MSVFSNYPGIYEYRHLPALAKTILNEHLKEFSVAQLALSRKYNIPLLKILTHFNDDQLIDLTMKSVAELLSCLQANKAAEYIENALQKWMLNQMEIVGKYDIVAEDITLLNHVRARNLKNYANRLYSDNGAQQELINEIDDFFLASTTSGSNTFITILKDRIKDEEEFKFKLSNALPGSIYVVDMQTNEVLLANDKLSETLGYPAKQLTEAGIEFYRSITHPDDWIKIAEHINNLNTNIGQVSSVEVRLRTSNGKYKWLRSYETNLRRNSNGEIGEIIGVSFDVTGEKEITEALALREAQLLEAQSIAHVGSFEWHISGHSSTTNTPEIYKIFEFSSLEKFDQFMQHVHPEDVDKVKDALRESFTTGNYECLYRYVRNRKEKIIWSKGIVTIENGKPLKMVGTVQDVTTIKQIEAELKEKTELLQKSNESLQQFASVASHDLKEPIRKISIYCSKVLRDEKDRLADGSAALLQKVMNSAVRMQRMIDDILQFSFIESNQEKQQAGLEDILTDVKELLSETIVEKKATIVYDGLPKVKVIVPQFTQLFQNLIANALKFSKPDVPPVIKITHKYVNNSANTSSQLEIKVEDNGIGFDENNEEKIFGLFYRLHNKAKFEGSGLGLSICRKIVEKHGGKITALSTPGEGATFIIVVPE